jgi:flagellar hook-associated protein 2
MTSGVGSGSISLSGLLGGTAGQIDTTSLINSLMQAESIPQNQLRNQLTTQKSLMMAYQAINSKVSAMQTAAQALTDPTAWTATSAASSAGSVVATSDGTATAGSTTFNVIHTASPQTSTIAADGSGNVVQNPAAGISVTGSDGTPHQISLTTGSASDVAAAINSAKVGVRATVITSDAGTILQLTSTSTGSNAAFTTGGFDNAAQTVVAAQNAQIGVGDPAAGGYTISSQTNTFTGAIPGVTFTVSAPASNVTISVVSDEQSLSTKMKALVDAANVARSEISADTAQGGPLQGTTSVNNLLTGILSAVSAGTASGGSLKTYGIDVDKNGVLSFDATAFAAKYSQDPSGTQTAISGSFANSLDKTATAAIAPVFGSVTQTITSITNQEGNLNDQITTWTSRLADIQTRLQHKYAAMETALAGLQSKQSYLTSMLKSINGSSTSTN